MFDLKCGSLKHLSRREANVFIHWMGPWRFSSSTHIVYGQVKYLADYINLSSKTVKMSGCCSQQGVQKNKERNALG